MNPLFVALLLSLFLLTNTIPTQNGETSASTSTSKFSWGKKVPQPPPASTNVHPRYPLPQPPQPLPLPPQPQEVKREDAILSIHTTPEFTQKVMNSEKPFLVMYTFDGCKACQTVSPRLENYVFGLKGNALYAKINTDQVNITDAGSITSYPSIQVFRKGVKSQILGPKAAQNGYQNLLQTYLVNK